MQTNTDSPGRTIAWAPTDYRAAARVSLRVTAISWFGLFAEGYDIGALGAVMPRLMADPTWHLDPESAGFIASAALVGMFFGAYCFGIFSDRFGRKPSFVACLAVFSLASGLAAFAPSPSYFAALRFVAGLGIGGIVPSAAALTAEYAPPGRANRNFALMYTGYSLGIFAAALTSFMLVKAHGWRLVIGLGGAPLLMVPVIVWLLPESLHFLVGQGRNEAAAALAHRLKVPLPDGSIGKQENTVGPGLRALFLPGRRSATLGFWFATFAGMILVYGLNTWLPQIMRAAGYDLGPSIMFLGVFALSSSVGGLLLGAVADRAGRRVTIVGSFLVGALAIMTLSRVWPLPVTYGVVALAGIGTVAAAVMVTSYLSSYFPGELRATAVGCCISFSRFGAVCGPILGGMIAKHHLPITWNFIAFALAGLLAAFSILLVPREGASA